MYCTQVFSNCQTKLFNSIDTSFNNTGVAITIQSLAEFFSSYFAPVHWIILNIDFIDKSNVLSDYNFIWTTDHNLLLVKYDEYFDLSRMWCSNQGNRSETALYNNIPIIECYFCLYWTFINKSIVYIFSTNIVFVLC